MIRTVLSCRANEAKLSTNPGPGVKSASDIAKLRFTLCRCEEVGAAGAIHRHPDEGRGLRQLPRMTASAFIAIVLALRMHRETAVASGVVGLGAQP